MKHLKSFNDLNEKIKIGTSTIETENGLMRIDKITRTNHNGKYWLHLNYLSKNFDPHNFSFSCDIECPIELLKDVQEEYLKNLEEKEQS